MKKIKAIIDTDPGVDDATALIFAMFEPKLDVKLLTSVRGNIPVSIATHNICFLLDLFNKDIPVSKGATKGPNKTPPDARWLHGKEGLGSYIPPKQTMHKPIKENAVEKMYEIIKQNPYEIVIFVLGPHTNVANLITAHPDCVELIKQIVFMGGNPYGNPDFPNHDSFNVRSDADSFNKVLESGIPLLMVPSAIGRHKAGLYEKDVEKVLKYGDIGNFLEQTYENYLEPNLLKQGLKIVATNDTCAIYSKLYPKMFKIKNANITVDLKENVGRTYADIRDDGAIEMVVDVNKKAFLRKFFQTLKKLSKLKLDITKKDYAK